jgi:hypothetical protein
MKQLLIVPVLLFAASNLAIGQTTSKNAGQGTYEVSRDGKTWTARLKGIDASGAEFEQVIGFDRA